MSDFPRDYPPPDDVPNPADPRLAWRSWQSVAEYLGGPIVSPYQYAIVEVWRLPWPKPQVIELAKLDPAFNVAGLWWRPWPLIHPRFDGP